MTKHPGSILLENFMKPLGITANQLAKGLGINRSTIGRLITGKHSMTREMAARLGAYFQVPAKWWLTMQLEYDVQMIAKNVELCEGITPLELDASILLTPSGVLHLEDSDDHELEAPVSISKTELEKLPQTSMPQKREVRVVHHESGSVALVGESS